MQNSFGHKQNLLFVFFLISYLGNEDKTAFPGNVRQGLNSTNNET